MPSLTTVRGWARAQRSTCRRFNTHPKEYDHGDEEEEEGEEGREEAVLIGGLAFRIREMLKGISPNGRTKVRPLTFWGHSFYDTTAFSNCADPTVVMAGLVPAIHVLLCGQGVDARHKAGHDGCVWRN